MSSDFGFWILGFGFMQTGQVFAFGFSNVAILGWLAAAAAPLLIHLWSRHRFRETPWAAMQFLLAAMRKNARRLQLQQWLLLAVRTLIILLVVLALAEPYGEELMAGGTAVPSHRILVIDGSYSMAYRTNGNTNFARAKQMATDMVRASGPGDVFTIILMASVPKLVLGTDVYDHTSVIHQIETLAQTHEGDDLGRTLSLVRDAISSKGDRRLPERKQIFVYTDLQRRAWEPLANGKLSGDKTKQSAIADAIHSISSQATIFLFDLSQRPSENLAVTSWSAADPIITTGREIGFDATLHNFGREPQMGSRVELLVDDVAVGERTVDVSAGGDASIHFVHKFSFVGFHIVTVRTASDRLDVDNVRSLVVPVREEIRVLCVSGREGAAKYVSDALNPNPAGNSSIRPVVIGEGDFDEAELSNFDCVFLCNVAQLTTNEAQRLAHYVEAGGGLVLFLGDRVLPDRYNAQVSFGKKKNSPQEMSAPLLPVQIGGVVAQKQFGIDPLEYRHPIVSPFRGRERAGLLTTPINRYFKLDISQKSPGTEIAARTTSGDPLIVTSPLEHGRVVLIGTDCSLSSVDSASREPWTSWPTWPSFLPIVREILAYATSGQHSKWQQPVGTQLVGSVAGVQPSNANQIKLHVVRPDGRVSPVSMQTTPSGEEWSYPDTDRSGIYSVRGLPGGHTQQFAVNVDTVESDLATVDARKLPPEIKVGGMLSGDAIGPSSPIQSLPWARSVLWAVVALMFVESLMAWQFGRGAL
jgi:hypothetical protein